MKRAFSRKNLWEAVPPAIRDRVGGVIGRLPPQWLLGKRFRQNLAFVREAQFWSADRTRTYQLDQLQRICTLAYERTSFYRRMFDEAGFRPGDLKQPEDLQRLPLIDKHTLWQHLDEMCARDPRGRDVDSVSTGGSSGEPLRFYIDGGRSSVEYAYLFAGWERAGYRLDTPQAVFRGMIVPEDRDGLRHQYDPLLRRHYYSNFHMTDDNIRRYLAHVATLGPCYLHVYPSSAATLARYLQRTGEPPPRNIDGILAGSENVYADGRALVEQVFGRRMFSWYGHSEKLVLGAECEHSSDYHIWSTYGYFELLDEAGHPVTKAGGRGEIIGTGFINSVVPFIRYRTGDYATYVGDRCAQCGREQPIVRDLLGHRSQEMLVAGDGSTISWTAMNMHDDTFVDVRQFQFRQDEPGRAILKVVPAGAFGDAERQRIERNLDAKLDGRVRFSIEIVDEIPLTRSGKSTYVDQRIDLTTLGAGYAAGVCAAGETLA